jgi:endo-1,4-beta-mannosidase
MPPLLTIDGKPTFLLGVNYWSRGGGPRMWDRFDPARVQAELAQMRGIGLNTCRSFAFLPSFMPQPGALDAAVLARLRLFFDLCQAEQMTTLPSLLVGHMSGENFDFVGQQGRSPYTDPELLSWQEQIALAVGRAGAGHPAVIAYLASNEMPLWGGASDPVTIRAWADRLRAALSEGDAERPFSLGDGVMNLKGGQNGFDVPTLLGVVDFLGPHTYQTDADPFRQAINAEFCLRSLTYAGLPVLLEEFGCSSSQASEENQALYYREAILGCLSVGGSGALGWCFSDFDLPDETPYRHHAFELGFGITRADGSEKPVCDELRAIASLIERLPPAQLTPPEPRAAIVVPSYYNTTYPFSGEDRDRMRRTLLQSYQLCAAASLEAELVPEEADLGRYDLLLVPATQKLLAPTWRALLEHASRGATVYWSYFNGDYSYHQGTWCQLFTELTGCTHQLRYGVPDLPTKRVALRGAGLSLASRTDVGAPFPRAFLPIEPVALRNTEVLARDDAGRPALTRVRHGAGQVFFLAYPWEYYLAEQHGVNRENPAHHLYRRLAREAGIVSPVICEHPSVQARVCQSPQGRVLWLFNHDWIDVRADLDTPGGTALHGAVEALREGRSQVTLGPKEVAVYQLAPARTDPMNTP